MLPTYITNNELFQNIVSIFILIPIVWFLLGLFKRIITKREEQLTIALTNGFNKISNDFKEGIKDIKDVFEKHEKTDHYHLDKIHESIKQHNEMSINQFSKIMNSVGNTVLNEYQTYNLFLEKMWSVSYGKLEFLRLLLIKNHIKGREKEIKKRVKAELGKQSQIYIKDFQEFTTPVGDLSDWLDKNFTEKQFDLFIDDIVKIIYKEFDYLEDKKLKTELKINEISTLMKTLQNKLGDKLRKDMKDKN